MVQVATEDLIILVAFTPEVSKVLEGFTGANSVVDYAKAGIITCVNNGIIYEKAKQYLR